MKNTFPIIYHGSENSLDVDAYIIVDKPLTAQESKELCTQYTSINANLICVEAGQVSWCYKGVEDECNNSILATYHLHTQEFPNPIAQPMPRQYALKMLRTIRGLLSYCSRTEHRESVKKALQSRDLFLKIKVLESIDLTRIVDFKKNNTTEVYKFFAFQMAQTRALLEDNEEIFTKNAAALKYPQLAPYLKREKATARALQIFFKQYLKLIKSQVKKVAEQEYYATNFHGNVEVVDTDKEITLPPVAVFDIDGTLLDDIHRKHYRDSAQWEEYFKRCVHDTPISHVISLTHQYKNMGYEVWLMSGRSEDIMQETLDSLARHNVAFDHIKLRHTDSRLPAQFLKPAWISRYIGRERVRVVFDDSPEVIAGFQKKGLNVIDVNHLSPQNIKNFKL